MEKKRIDKTFFKETAILSKKKMYLCNIITDRL